MAEHTVFPLRCFDDTPLWRAFILYYMFAFDSVLDPEKLKSSLELLSRHNGWKKFGARIRKNANGNLEYHFYHGTDIDEKYQVISYSHEVIATTSAQHPIACHLPDPATTRPAVVTDPDKFEGLFRPDDGPTKLDDYLNSDRPQMGLHVVCFLDKTLVTVYFPHTLMDGMSMAPFLEAWTLALQGRASEIQSPFAPEGQETSRDPLDEFSTEATDKHVLASHQMSITGLAGWALRNISSFFTSLENRMVCVPASTMARLHEEANIDFAADRACDESAPFLSDGDLLCAWWTKLLLTTAGVTHNPNKTIVLNNAYSLRKVLLDSNTATENGTTLRTVPCSNNIYVSNLAAFFNVILTAGDILQQPMYRTALAIRTALNTQRTRPQAAAFLRMWRNSWGKIPPMFGSWDMDLITFSNWTQADLFNFDFSAAVVEVGARRQPVKPMYVQNNQFGLKLPNAFPIMGRDRSGNFWLSGYLKKGHWCRIEARLGAHGSTNRGEHLY